MTKIFIKSLSFAVGSALAASFVLAATASADTVSAAYCNAVAQKYERYLGGTAARGRLQSGVETNQAMEACKRGDTSGVAVLEKALQNAKIPLPPRS